MEKSHESMEFEDWELIPVTKHNHINTNNEDMLAIDTDYFSNECKDIQVIPQTLSPPPVILLNEDQFIGMKVETPKFSTEKEGGEEHELCEKEMDTKKEKQCFWMIGAVSSIGVVAATICIFVLAGKNPQYKHSGPKIQFQLYTDEKRIKEVVKQATQMRHALSAVRGNSTTRRAHVSFGGYYDGV